MAFDSLSFRYSFIINNYPHRWLPLVHLYDPDLPQYPLYYFHVLSSDLALGTRPGERDRAFGYVERVSYDGNNLDVHIVLNKDFDDAENKRKYERAVINEVRERFGVNNPVTKADISSTFSIPDYSNKTNDVINELWERVVRDFYDNKLPFGRLWDPVLGLSRFVASWYSPSGRKGEYIQTHYFSSKFGERITSSSRIPNVDFYLLPTYEELIDTTNHLNYFPKYKSLLNISANFNSLYCAVPKSVSNRQVAGITSSIISPAEGRYNIVLSNFTLPPAIIMPGEQLNTRIILAIINTLTVTSSERALALECYNAFDKGPQRTIIFWLMLNDIRKGKLSPTNLTKEDMEIIYNRLDGTYQSPKVISIYAQQCFGNVNALPIDTWVETFLRFPLTIGQSVKDISKLFRKTNNIGKLERLIWVCSQARKVHSSACNNSLWCMKYGDPNSDYVRGANPFSCTICLDTVRDNCPAFEKIKDSLIEFDTLTPSPGVKFKIETGYPGSADFKLCEEISNRKDKLIDLYSPKDMDLFLDFPQSLSHGTRGPLTVQQFYNTYRK